MTSPHRRYFAGIAFLLCFCQIQLQQVAARAEQFDSAEQAISYTVYGEGPPVILLHGMTGNQSNLTPLRKAVLDAGYMVIAFDSRGHGESGKPHAPDAYGTVMVDDVVRLLDHLKIKRAHAIGYSMGGDVTNTGSDLRPIGRKNYSWRIIPKLYRWPPRCSEWPIHGLCTGFIDRSCFATSESLSITKSLREIRVNVQRVPPKRPQSQIHTDNHRPFG